MPMSRREMLARTGAGFGAVALAALASEWQSAAAASLASRHSPGSNPLAPRPPQFPARAKQVIFLFMDGGPSQVDTFDPKPRLTEEHGQPFKMKMEPTQFNNNGSTLGSPWKFAQYGQSGLPVSELFPHVARHVDDLAVVRSMTSKFSEHTTANYFLHTGLGQQGRPSMGAWCGYGLGSECQDLPGFVVLNGGLIPPGGLDNFSLGLSAGQLSGLVVPAQRCAGGQHPPAGSDAPAAGKQAGAAAQNRRRRGRAFGERRSGRIGHRQL